MAKHLLCMKDLCMYDSGERRFTKGKIYSVIRDDNDILILLDDIDHEHYICHPNDKPEDDNWSKYFTDRLTAPFIAKPNINVIQSIKIK